MSFLWCLQHSVIAIAGGGGGDGGVKGNLIYEIFYSSMCKFKHKLLQTHFWATGFLVLFSYEFATKKSNTENEKKSNLKTNLHNLKVS